MKSLYKYLLVVVLVLIGFFIWMTIPFQLFDDPQACVLYDAKGNLVDASVAIDGQWRLPMPDSVDVPEKYITCLLSFEDKRFYKHFGIDWLAMGRACMQNIRSRSIVSGGSTISMQVIRISRKGKKRSIGQKLIEMALAQKLELQNSKSEILKLYAANAPYGGNIVGIQAASQRYFGRDPDDLTWAESALLAVLPNAPSSIHMNKNREMLLEKRNRLLKRLYDDEIISENDYQLAIVEEIPDALRPFPHKATHLLMRLKKENPDKYVFVTHLNNRFQLRAQQILEQHSSELKKNGINNAACIIVDTRTGSVKAYVGNTGLFSSEGEYPYVDVVTSSRSTGSVLKPFLYAYMLSKGELLQNSLVADVPSRYGNFSPQNFNLGYDGAVQASHAIVRSLNVPSVNMLQKHGVPVFLQDLHDLNIHSINRSADNYGLSLILGGAEARLDELTAAYASMGRRLLNYTQENSLYHENDIHNLMFALEDSMPVGLPVLRARLSSSGIWFAFEAMKTLKRPTEQGNWEFFNSEQAIAWKTGTSYGFRDAWAIGVTPDYTVGVWVGNADGEGRAGLIGLRTAAPVLFDLFDMLPAYDKWFDCPWDDMIKMPVCSKSGYLASEFCDEQDSVWIPSAAYHFPQCPYHQLVYTDLDEQYRVNRSCFPADEMKEYHAFVLPPSMEWYYRQKNPWYKGSLPLHPNCEIYNGSSMQIIYPDDHMRIYLPVDLNGERQKTVFEAAHHNNKMKVFWHIDDKYITTTVGHHQIAVNPKKGKHVLSIVDEDGNKVIHRFEILEKPSN